MRVLMLTELYPPFIGGSEQHVRNLSRGLVERGHDVAVATMAADNMESIEDDDGVRVHRVASTTRRLPSVLTPSGRPYVPPFPDPDVVSSLRRLVEDEQPDVVHAHNWMVHSFLPLKRQTDTPLAMTLHDYGIECAKKSLIYRERPCDGPGFSKCLHCAARHYGTARAELITLGNWATQRPLRASVDMFLPVSEAVARGNSLDRHDVAYEVIPNFVPDDVATEGSDDLAQLPDEPFWLYVGTLSHHKGVQLLLDAYQSLESAPPLVIIGRRSPDGPEAFPDGTLVLYDMPHEDVMAAWRRASLGIVPSLFPDPCPTVALEAMACGVPLVGSRTGGLPEIIDDGKTGLLFDVGDRDGLANALETLRDDTARLSAMSDAARSRAGLFMASNVIGRIESVYNWLVS
jgi:glycosyltransferase involved in cell wall biosynthesis